MKIESNRQPEEQLVESAQNGHLESFGALYQRYYSSMVALAYSALGNRDFAEDAAQEVFAVACRDLTYLKHRDKFGAWLAGICRNITRQMIREKARAAVSNLSVPVQNQDNHEHHLDLVHRAVRQLRPAERELVVLRYYDGFSYAQISNVLGISPQAVNGRLIRAKRKIAEHLKRNGFRGEEL
jgi:RNA polymerase sigma-70 factor (ECF subfamily)